MIVSFKQSFRWAFVHEVKGGLKTDNKSLSRSRTEWLLWRLKSIHNMPIDIFEQQTWCSTMFSFGQTLICALFDIRWWGKRNYICKRTIKKWNTYHVPVIKYFFFYLYPNKTWHELLRLKWCHRRLFRGIQCKIR